LREHRLTLRNSGIVNWPPEWKPVAENRGIVQGEIGILEDASMHDLLDNKIFLAMMHLSERYTAVLAFDDQVFAKQLYLVLLKNLGRQIREIGDLDLSLFTKSSSDPLP
jgi:hypothetical protein